MQGVAPLTEDVYHKVAYIYQTQILYEYKTHNDKPIRPWKQ